MTVLAGRRVHGPTISERHDTAGDLQAARAKVQQYLTRNFNDVNSLPAATAQWKQAERGTIAELREAAYPFGAHFINCFSWTFAAENGAHQPELWQVHLGQAKGSGVNGCNTVNVYRGWAFVGRYVLPDNDVFTGQIIIQATTWTRPYETNRSENIYATKSATGAQVAMNPIGTNIELKTKRGRSLQFSLDGAGKNGFELR